MKILECLLLIVSWERSLGFAPSLRVRSKVQSQCSTLQHSLPPNVWVEEAEANFVDDEENLEEGEVCWKSFKSFASNPDDVDNPRFLCAGALVQRADSLVCDAWTADAILDEGGPNLQLQGACQLLDELLQCHLQRHSDDPMKGLRTFVLQCGSAESKYSCASYMAGQSRGFRSLKLLLRSDSTYTPHLYDNNVEGMVLDCTTGKERYETLASSGNDNLAASQIISHLLPDAQTIRRHTNKRYSV